ncbi:MAG: hypothetical protein WCJ01_04650 [Ignavibacteria bacterium]
MVISTLFGIHWGKEKLKSPLIGYFTFISTILSARILMRKIWALGYGIIFAFLIW